MNKKPRASTKGSYSQAAQRRLWDILVQQTGADIALPQPGEAALQPEPDVGVSAGVA